MIVQKIMLRGTTEKTEYVDELEKLVEEGIEEPGAMKMSNFKKDAITKR